MVQEMQQLQRPIQMPEPETDSSSEIRGMPFLPTHKLSAAARLVMETPARSSNYHSPHYCVRRDLTFFDYSWTVPHL